MYIIFIHCFPKSPIDSRNFILPLPPNLTGPLSSNHILSAGNRVLDGMLYGPESLAIHGTSRIIYSGLKTGHIVAFKIETNGLASIVHKFDPIASIAQSKCDGSYSMQPVCGRPLGLRFRKHNTDLLLVADAYYGLYEMNIRSGERKTILKSGTKITGAQEIVPPVRHFNDFDELFDGRIILSEPSTKFSDRDCLYAMTEHNGDGRLLIFDPGKKQLKVLINHLQYPNGVQLTHDGSCVLFAEMGKLRVLKYCFAERMPQKLSVLLANLPGYPDNIRFARNGSLWIPLGETRLEDDRWITQRAWLRNLIARLTSPRSFAKLVDWLSSKHAILLLVDPGIGTILGSLHDPSGKTISSISQVVELDNRTLLLGGDENNFLVKVTI